VCQPAALGVNMRQMESVEIFKKMDKWIVHFMIAGEAIILIGKS
jgi:hypothetical protein